MEISVLDALQNRNYDESEYDKSLGIYIINIIFIILMRGLDEDDYIDEEPKNQLLTISTDISKINAINTYIKPVKKRGRKSTKRKISELGFFKLSFFIY